MPLGPFIPMASLHPLLYGYPLFGMEKRSARLVPGSLRTCSPAMNPRAAGILPAE